MSLSDFMASILAILKAARIDHMLSGSLAGAYHTVARATQDVDLVIEVDREQVEALVRGCQEAGFYVDREAALTAVRTRSQFNVIDASSGWKADFIIRKDRPFSREEFDRRQPATLLGIDTWVATVEDLILSKLEWAAIGDSAIQRRDVRALVGTAGDSLDRDYIEQWVDEIGARSEWEAVRDPA